MATRITHARKMFVTDSGEVVKSAVPNWTALRIELVAPEKDDKDQFVVTRTLDFARAGLPDDIILCAAAYGLSQKMGDNYAGIEKKAEALEMPFTDTEGYADAIEALCSEMYDNFTAGVWVEKTDKVEKGGNVTMLLDSMLRAFAEAGQEVTDEQKAALAEKLKTTEYREKVRANPSVLKHYADIQAEKAAARAKAAAEKAATQEGNGLADLLGA